MATTMPGGMNTEGQPSRILVADDEEIIREMLFSYLTDEGYEVEMAADGREAVAMADSRDYNVIITDIRMPGGSGMDVLKAAKNRSMDTEVIVMTAFSTEDLAIEAVRLGAYDYLKKPIDDLGLFALLVRQIVQKQLLARENQRLVEDLQSKNAELNGANAKLMAMATTDPLTGVYNRRYILARLEQQFQQTLRYGECFALLMLDIDHFKQVNDTWGHQVGDEILRHFVQTVRPLIRATDLFGRYGGEEFMMVLLGASVDDARATARRLRAEVEASPLDAGAATVAITVSIGFSSAPHDGIQSPSDLVRAADEALYRAKASGRNRVVYADEVTVPA